MSRMDEVNLGDGVVVAVVEPSSEVEVRTAGTRSVAASCGPELHAVRSNDAASTDVDHAAAVVLAAHSRVTRLPVLSRHRGPLSLRSSARSEEHTSELQSLMRISYAVFCLKKKNAIHSRSTN